MKTQFAFVSFVVLVALRIMYYPSQPKTDMPPFASPAPLPATTITVVPAKPAGTHAGSNERLILKWIIGDNREGTCFNSTIPLKGFYEMTGNGAVLKDIN